MTSEAEQRQTSEKKCQEVCSTLARTKFTNYLLSCLFTFQFEEELSGVRRKLLESEQLIEIMKNSNRELNAKIVSQ